MQAEPGRALSPLRQGGPELLGPPKLSCWVSSAWQARGSQAGAQHGSSWTKPWKETTDTNRTHELQTHHARHVHADTRVVGQERLPTLRTWAAETDSEHLAHREAFAEMGLAHQPPQSKTASLQEWQNPFWHPAWDWVSARNQLPDAPRPKTTILGRRALLRGRAGCCPHKTMHAAKRGQKAHPSAQAPGEPPGTVS